VSRRATKVALGTIGLAVALLASGELAARKLTTPVPDEFVTVSLLGRVRMPGFSADRVTLEEQPRTFRFETNVVGFRGKSA
jgi:hypothetical protein